MSFPAQQVKHQWPQDALDWLPDRPCPTPSQFPRASDENNLVRVTTPLIAVVRSGWQRCELWRQHKNPVPEAHLDARREQPWYRDRAGSMVEGKVLNVVSPVLVAGEALHESVRDEL